MLLRVTLLAISLNFAQVYIAEKGLFGKAGLPTHLMVEELSRRRSAANHHFRQSEARDISTAAVV
jgi:hypothetical protein